MKSLSKKIHEYKTFEEFENRFYPNSQKEKERKVIAEDPYIYGTNLARESLEKIKRALSKK